LKITEISTINNNLKQSIDIESTMDHTQSHIINQSKIMTKGSIYEKNNLTLKLDLDKIKYSVENKN